MSKDKYVRATNIAARVQTQLLATLLMETTYLARPSSVHVALLGIADICANGVLALLVT